jgi:hypothetical protein
MPKKPNTSCEIANYLCARQNKESEKGLLNTNKQKNKYKDICKSERCYANKNKELSNY